MHEHPYLNSGNRQPLKEGETFSVEPGVYIEQAVDKEGSGIGVRLEDMVRRYSVFCEFVKVSHASWIA